MVTPLLCLLLLAAAVHGASKAPTKPDWPLEWSAPFGLYETDTPIKANISSMFYSKWPVLQAQLIVYNVQVMCIASRMHYARGMA